MSLAPEVHLGAEKHEFRIQLASAWRLLLSEYHLEVFEPIVYRWLCNAC